MESIQGNLDKGSQKDDTRLMKDCIWAYGHDRILTFPIDVQLGYLPCRTYTVYIATAV